MRNAISAASCRSLESSGMCTPSWSTWVRVRVRVRVRVAAYALPLGPPAASPASAATRRKCAAPDHRVPAARAHAAHPRPQGLASQRSSRRAPAGKLQRPRSPRKPLVSRRARLVGVRVGVRARARVRVGARARARARVRVRAGAPEPERVVIIPASPMHMGAEGAGVPG